MAEYEDHPLKRRMLRGHQPARAVLLDLTHVAELGAWRRVLAALEGFLALACSMAGPPRIPLLSLYLLDAFPELALPFCPPKGNLSRVLSALRDIRAALEDRGGGAARGSGSCLALGVMEACGQYSRHLNALGHTQTSGTTQQQLEVVLLTGATKTQTRALLDGLVDQVDMTRLKRLVATLLVNNDPDQGPTPESSNTSAREADDSGIVDFIFLDTDEASLQRFFYTWLTDTSSDSEHLQLVMPPPSPADRELIIKLDLIETMVNPTQLPHHEFFSLHADNAHVKHVFPCPSKAAGLTVPVYRLHVIASLPVTAICDSLVFGMPLAAQATACWRSEWEELEENQARFAALCQELQSQERVLLVKNKSSGSPPTPGAGKNQAKPAATTDAIEGLFVLLPGPNSSLLVKALAPRELALPVAPSGVAGEDGASLLTVQASLIQVPNLPAYDPLGHSSGLLDVLLRQAAPKQQAVKPRPAPKRKTPAPRDGGDDTWATAGGSGSGRGRGARGRGDYSQATSRGGYSQAQASRGRGDFHQIVRGRGDYSQATARGAQSAGNSGYQRRLAGDAGAGRPHVAVSRPDGFLTDLE